MSGFPLTIQVPADEWAFVQRRAAYLECLIVRALRDEAGAQEWFSAAELAALRLPGLPLTTGGITRRGTAERWRQRRDRDADGRTRMRYHVAGLPRRAFDTIVGRILDLDAAPAEPGSLLPAAPKLAPIEAAASVEPPWVLPLVRLVKSSADVADAWKALPAALPPGVGMPTVREAAAVLVRLGLG